MKSRRVYVGLGSGHTDRKTETIGVRLSEQMCGKPVSNTIWSYEQVANHWVSLLVRRRFRVFYLRQASRYTDSGALMDETAMFSGSMPAIGGIRSASRLEAELVDPVLGRAISSGYDVETLPVRE